MVVSLLLLLLSKGHTRHQLLLLLHGLPLLQQLQQLLLLLGCGCYGLPAVRHVLLLLHQLRCHGLLLLLGW
jgi:hypothetical protein